MLQLGYTKSWSARLMSAYKPRKMQVFRDAQVLHDLTPGSLWHGDKEFIGKVQQAVLVDGSYYDAEGGKFCMGEGSWVLVTEGNV